MIGWIIFLSAFISDFSPSCQPSIWLHQRMPTGKKVVSENISPIFIQKTKQYLCWATIVSPWRMLPVSPPTVWGCFRSTAVWSTSNRPELVSPEYSPSYIIDWRGSIFIYDSSFCSFLPIFNQDFGQKTTSLCHLSITRMESDSFVRV